MVHIYNNIVYIWYNIIYYNIYIVYRLYIKLYKLNNVTRNKGPLWTEPGYSGSERFVSRICSQLIRQETTQPSHPYLAWQTDWNLWPSEPSLSGLSHLLPRAGTWRGTRPQAVQNRPQTHARASRLCGLPSATEHSGLVSVAGLRKEVSHAASLRKSCAFYRTCDLTLTWYSELIQPTQLAFPWWWVMSGLRTPHYSQVDSWFMLTVHSKFNKP